MTQNDQIKSQIKAKIEKFSEAKLKQTLDFYTKHPDIQKSLVNINNSEQVFERVLAVQGVHNDNNVIKHEFFAVTNLRICFLPSNIDPLSNIINNKCQFIPLDQVDLESVETSFGRYMNGASNKLKISVHSLSNHSKFEKLQYAQNNKIFSDKAAIEKLQFYFNVYLKSENKEENKLIVNAFYSIKNTYFEKSRKFFNNFDILYNKISKETADLLRSCRYITEEDQVHICRQITFEDELAESVDQAMSTVNLDQVREELLKDYNLKSQLRSFTPEQQSTTFSATVQREGVESMISSIGYDRKHEKLRPEVITMVLKKEMVKFLLRSQLQSSQLHLDVEAIINEFIQECGQDQDTIISSDFQRFTDYLARIKAQKKLRDSNNSLSLTDLNRMSLNNEINANLTKDENHNLSFTDNHFQEQNKSGTIVKFNWNSYQGVIVVSYQVVVLYMILFLYTVSSFLFSLENKNDKSKFINNQNKQIEAEKSDTQSNNPSLPYKIDLDSEHSDHEEPTEDGPKNASLVNLLLFKTECGDDIKNSRSQSFLQTFASFIDMPSSNENGKDSADPNYFNKFDDLRLVRMTESVQERLSLRDSLNLSQPEFSKQNRGAPMLQRDGHWLAYSLVCNMFLVDAVNKRILVEWKDGRWLVPVLKIKNEYELMAQVGMYNSMFTSECLDIIEHLELIATGLLRRPKGQLLQHEREVNSALPKLVRQVYSLCVTRKVSELNVNQEQELDEGPKKKVQKFVPFIEVHKLLQRDFTNPQDCNLLNDQDWLLKFEAV